ncbi:MAG: hypothetical protein E7634_01545 [Ruminococcaceae bacterium]|nr:hypothetical protein [Oscillospiraceae bacterium]
MENIKTALENWKRILVVSADADLSDPAVQKRLSNIEKEAEEARMLYDASGKDSLFLGRMPENTDEMVKEFRYMNSLAMAWGSYGSKYYKNGEVLEKILFSLEWMYENRFGQKEIDGVGWRDTRLFNWHRWQIDSPQYIMHILVVLGDILTPDHAVKYLKLFDHLVKKPRDYASNKVHFAKLIIGAGLLQRNEEKIYLALNNIEDTHVYVDGGLNDGQGFYTDGSYIFHTRHVMNGLYGQIHFAVHVEICKILKGTKYADPVIEEKMCRWALNSFIPFLAKGVVSRSVLGRYPNVGVVNGRKIMASICELAVVNVRYRDELLGHIKRNVLANAGLKNPDRMDELCALMSADACDLFRKILADDSFKPSEYNVNKNFGNADRMVHHNGNAAFSLSMSSERIYNYECINSVNMDGWYLGDGMLTAYSSDYMAYPGSYDKCDPYRRPGTTLDTRERQCVSVMQKNEYLSSRDFVGGVSDGKCGAAAMALESYHGDGTPERMPRDLSYGGAPEVRECSLTAKKAWFFYEKTAVCLGCDISAHDGAEVITVIDSRRTHNPIVIPEKGEFAIAGEIKALPRDVSALYIKGFGGYYFPEKLRLTAQRGGKDGSFTHIVASHGVDPQNEKYAYALLPELNESETAAYALSPEFRILSNTGSLQAVEWKNGVKMYVFWSACEFDGVEPDVPLMIILKDGKLYACDPTHKIKKSAVTVNGKRYSLDHTDKYGLTVSVEL